MSDKTFFLIIGIPCLIISFINIVNSIIQTIRIEREYREHKDDYKKFHEEFVKKYKDKYHD